VANLVAYGGQDAVSLTQTFAPGSYTVLLTAFTTDGSPLPAVSYSLQAERLDDSIGPQAENSGSSPSGSPPPSGSSATYSDSTTTTSSGTSSSSGSSTTTDSQWYYYGSGGGQPQNSTSSSYQPG